MITLVIWHTSHLCSHILMILFWSSHVLFLSFQTNSHLPFILLNMHASTTLLKIIFCHHSFLEMYTIPPSFLNGGQFKSQRDGICKAGVDNYSLSIVLSHPARKRIKGVGGKTEG